MKWLITMGAAAFIILISSFASVTIVDTGHRGVQTRFGEITKGPLTEGIYFYSPFTESMVEMSVRTQIKTLETSTYTKDVQQAKVRYGINYNLKADAVADVFQKVGRDWDKKLMPPVLEGGIKTIIGQFDAVELIANRHKATDMIFEQVNSLLNDKGVELTRLEIEDIEFTPEFETAVEAKVKAIQKAEEEKNRTIQIEEQAKQKVVAAKAEAESMRIRANALTQNKALVEWEAVQKWNGVMPQYMMGGSVPFVNVTPK